MDLESINFDEAMSNYVVNHLAIRIVRNFANRPKETIDLVAGIDELAFWRVAVDYAKKVGEQPTLLVSYGDQADSVNRFLYKTPSRSEELSIEHKDDIGSGNYLATIEGIDVFAAQIKKGHAWLFSARVLSSVEYARMGQNEEILLVDFEPSEDRISGALRFRYRQAARWKDPLIFELHFPSQRIGTETPT